MSVLVDSSVWIEYFRRPDQEESVILREPDIIRSV